MARRVGSAKAENVASNVAFISLNLYKKALIVKPLSGGGTIAATIQKERATHLKGSLLLACGLILMSCGKPNDAGVEQKVSSGATPPDYSTRLGIGVSTAARTCIAVHNPNLTPEAQVTLVTLTSPQTFTQAQMVAASSTPCPVSKDLDPNLSSYDIKVTGAPVPKMVPLAAAIGATNTFLMDNATVTADLNQDGHKEYFRGCAGKDGVHVTAWAGSPLVSTLAWHGFYYEPADPGTFPACSAKELAGL